MKFADLDETMTIVPIEDAIDAMAGAEELAVIPARELERGTACLLVARRRHMWIACRADHGGPSVPPTVGVEPVEWREVGIGPLGIRGRVPGGVLGGAASTDHILTVAAGNHLYEARLAGQLGMDAVEGFASIALHAGARDYEP